jgi:hypothetical protein
MACFGVLSFGYGERLPATVMDVSKSGLRARIPRTLPPGMCVEILWGRTAIFGEVRYCKKAGTGQFDIGVRVEEIVLGKAKPRAEHLPVSTLTLFMTGRLSGHDRREASEHLEICPLCKHQLLVLQNGRIGCSNPAVTH